MKKDDREASFGFGLPCFRQMHFGLDEDGSEATLLQAEFHPLVRVYLFLYALFLMFSTIIGTL